ncbi:hypothetical protein HR45_13250 [Shewanella mangrovi]|uniref:Lipoprotein n=1 Tax=Shewanella mangrovi TaxID=1515746 RepID=A0A094JX55_9GAMM|nr:hypothetical protein [Shewanella mangrovi]KFZ37006.1 hypothetical protein HR45_13250 [Shewanella mangrovi]
MNNKGLLLAASIIILSSTITGCSSLSQNIYDQTAKSNHENTPSRPHGDSVSREDVENGVFWGAMDTLWQSIFSN